MVTTEDLAAMVAKGFLHMDDRFAQIDDRFALIDGRFCEIDARLAQIDDRLQAVEMKIVGTNARLDSLVEKTPSREELSALEGRVATLEPRRRR